MMVMFEDKMKLFIYFYVIRHQILKLQSQLFQAKGCIIGRIIPRRQKLI